MQKQVEQVDRLRELSNGLVESVKQIKESNSNPDQFQALSQTVGDLAKAIYILQMAKVFLNKGTKDLQKNETISQTVSVFETLGELKEKGCILSEIYQPIAEIQVAVKRM